MRAWHTASEYRGRRRAIKGPRAAIGRKVGQSGRSGEADRKEAGKSTSAGRTSGSSPGLARKRKRRASSVDSLDLRDETGNG